MAATNEDKTEFQVNRISLSFKGFYNNLEESFIKQYHQSSVAQIRIVLFITCIAFGLFSLVDYFLLPEIHPTILIMRFGVYIPVLILVILLSYKNWFAKYQPFIISLSTLTICIGIILMIKKANGEILVMPFIGLMLIVILQYTSFKQRFIASSINGTIIILTYSSLLLGFPNVTLRDQVFYFLYLIIANLVGMFISYTFEYSERKNFFISHLHENKKQQNHQKLLNRIIFGTKELNQVNEKLKEAIVSQQEAEKKLVELSTIDIVTGLPNRGLLLDRIEHAIIRASISEELLAVLVLDLDNFKCINDIYGHAAGDELLMKVSQRLSKVVRADDTISRLGGDEFSIVLEGLKQLEHISMISKKILEGLAEPFILNEVKCYITASMGIAIFPHNGKSAESILQRAEDAMFRAKHTGKNNFHFSSEEMTEAAIKRMSLGINLRMALERHELTLHYQPQVNIFTQEIHGVEALLRWNHPTMGLIYPGQMIDIAEETGLIIPIGEWVFQRSFNQLKKWDEIGYKNLTMAVNISSRQLRRSEQLITCLKRSIDETGVDPTRIEIELTEGIIFQNIKHAHKTLQDINNLGINLAIDDFGAGYSTLAQLAHLPIKTLKIDKSFADNLTKSENDAAVAAGIVSIAQKLNKQIIAEGVETQDQIEFYASQGCEMVQGWYYSRAKSPEEIEQVMNKGFKKPVLVLS